MEALSLATVHGILILDNDGKRIQCKYFSDTFPTLKEQLKFEETLFRKTHKANGWYWNSQAVQLPVLSGSFSPSPLSPF
jgi:hypothetical protein